MLDQGQLKTQIQALPSLPLGLDHAAAWGWGESSFPSAQRGSLSPDLGGSPSRGRQGWVAQLQPGTGMAPWRLTGLRGQAGCGSHQSGPRCWETPCKTVLAVLQTWRHPQPRGHCKEPSP